MTSTASQLALSINLGTPRALAPRRAKPAPLPAAWQDEAEAFRAELRTLRGARRDMVQHAFANFGLITLPPGGWPLLDSAPMVTVYLVGCGKKKATRTSKASELYTGCLFQAARGYAETRGPWRILSALYGVVKPETKIKPYNYRLPHRDDEVLQWANGAATSLVRDFGSRFRVVCLAGRDYAAPLAAALARQGIECETPLDGLGVGQRLAFFKKARQS